MRVIGGLRRLLQRAGSRYCSTEASPEPSKVLYVRSTKKITITEDDILKLTKPFGSVNKFIHPRSYRNQALLQMDDLSEAANVVQHYATETPLVNGEEVEIQYSTYKELKDLTPVEEKNVGRVLLVSIRNPLYEINVDVLHEVFKAHGTVEKIVIFQRAGLQAFIQYDSAHSAIEAKSLLQDRQIYDGCCYLDIQFSKSSELEVKYSSPLSRNFMKKLPFEDPRLPEKTSILGAGNLYSYPTLKSGFNSAPSSPASGILPPGVTGLRTQNVLLISNLNAEKVNDDKLFNLFSGYGRIIRIKTFAGKPDQAFVQMADGLQAELALNFLKNTVLFGKPMSITFSKNNIIRHPDARDYTSASNNRFTSDFIKNCCYPARLVHISNLQSNVTRDELIEFFAPHGVVQNVKIFEASNASTKQAICEFGSIEQATEAIACKHLSRYKSVNIRVTYSRFQNIY